jgi:hypothetical protein
VLVGGQRETAFLAYGDERFEVASVILPRMVPIVVGCLTARFECVNEGEVKLAAVHLSRAALVNAVEIVPGELVCNEKTK